MTQIQTVRGPTGLDQLGQTMMHEHVFSGDTSEAKRSKYMDVATRELRELVDAGGQTLVDVGPAWSHPIEWYEEIASLVDLNIVLSTGFYLERLVPEPLRAMTEDQYVERFTKELTEGIGGSRIRAGVIKVAGQKAQLTDWERKVMRAAGRVQRETGVPICTHACEGARSQFDVLTQAGADPERIYLSHVEAEFGWEGRTLEEELDYLTHIARLGGSLYVNNFNFEFDTPHEDTMYLMHALCDRGFPRRVLFGIDANFRIDDEGQVWWEAQKEHPETANRDYAYTYTGAIPLMRKWGFGEEQFNALLVDNPRRLFSTTGSSLIETEEVPMAKLYETYVTGGFCGTAKRPLDKEGFVEMILYNPSTEPCQTTMTAYFEDRPPHTFEPVEVKPESNHLLVMPRMAPDIFEDCGFWGARFESTTPMVADIIGGLSYHHDDQTFQGGCVMVIGEKLHKQWHFADGFWLEHKLNLKGDLSRAPFPFNEIEYYYFTNPNEQDAKVDMTLQFRRIEHLTIHLTVPAGRTLAWCNFERIPYHQPYGVKVVSTEPIITSSTRFIYGLNGFEEWGLQTHTAMPPEPGPIVE